MKFSQFLIPTLKEDPAEAEVISHKLMLRAGLMRKTASGIYSWLPLGWRVIRKVENVIRQEMNAAGAQEVMLPAVQPAGLWQDSGRWSDYGKELLRFVDRHSHEYCLGPTHEEIITDIARREVRSYRDLPMNLYQIQTKFRDEIRPRFGVMRSREFIMKDAYSLDVDEDASAVSYRAMHRAYINIFTRLGLHFAVVEADSGSIGGSFSHEFMVLADTGEDAIVSCANPDCAYAANVEKAEIRAVEGGPAAATEEVVMIPTPGVRTVEEAAQALNTEPRLIAKSLVYLADGEPVLAVVAGDQEVNEIKLKNLIGAAEVVLAHEDAVRQAVGAGPGSCGPQGQKIRVFADQELYAQAALFAGGNKDGFHVSGVNLLRDAPDAVKADLRQITPADSCPRCGGAIGFARGIEVGHIFRLGTKYSKAMGAGFLDAEGVERPVVMGCYGIGVGRTAAAAIEQGHDDHGIIWPLPIAPVSVLIIPMKLEGPAWDLAVKLHDQLWEQGVDALLDDRDLRPGVKFKDADLLGIPLRVVLGPKGLDKGQVELKRRTGGELEMVPVESAVETLVDLFKADGGQSL